jgi:pimeloyl-ACP methyl ester carboxylesterase
LKYSIYVHDYGAPVGFRLASRHPERVQAIITQNGNAYEEGLQSSLDPMREYWKNPSEENEENISKLLAVKNQYVCIRYVFFLRLDALC